MPRPPAHETFERFMDDLAPLISQPCIIKTGQVWKHLRNKYSYSYIVVNFRSAMTSMEEQGRARRIDDGLWEVLKVSKVA